jgi:ABC-2 type transport system permease protein
MNTLWFLLEKEFRQIFRNKSIVALIMVMPVVQLLILPLAADYEIKNINLAVVDHDHSSYSRQLISKITASGYFKLQSNNETYDAAFAFIETDEADLILEIPLGFERNLVRENKQQVSIAVNAINGTKAGLGGAYLGQIIQLFNQDIRLNWLEPQQENTIAQIDIKPYNRFNQKMNYQVFMVPGILAILITMVGGFLSSLNIVKEKEVGTIEQINVSPIKKHIFILGKLIPFWVLGNVVFTIGLFVARIAYGIVPVGNLLLLYGFLWIFLLAVLGLGLLVSTYCETQQQAMFLMFFLMMIFILMGGLFTPINSMPRWAQWISAFNPLAYFIDVLRMIVLKGSGWRDILPHIGKILSFALVLNTWAIWTYRKSG